MLPYRLVRAFAVDGSDDVVELVKALELPLAPTRNQWVRLPDGSALSAYRLPATITLPGMPGAAGGWEDCLLTALPLPPVASESA